MGVFNTSYRGGFFAYGDPSSYEHVNGGATQELAGGMLVLCQNSLEYTRTVLTALEGEDSQYLTSAWEKLAKAEEQYHVAQIQIFEYLDYHASVQHSKRVLELCEKAVKLAYTIGVDDGDVLGGGASDYDLAWGAIERAYTLLNNLEDAKSKLNDLDVSVVKSVLDDARSCIELAETQLTDGNLKAAEGSVNEAMSLLGQAIGLLKNVSRDARERAKPEEEPENEDMSTNGNPQNEKEPENEDMSTNGNPQNEKEPEVEDDDDDEDNNEIDELVDQIEKWYERKKDKKDKDD